MSTRIVDRIEAIRFPKETTGHYADRFLVAELGGDNNVRCARTGKRARSWSATAIGQEWEVIGEACRFAASCSGGMTKLRGRATKPESYIRAYRKALANAATMAEARRVPSRQSPVPIPLLRPSNPPSALDTSHDRRDSRIQETT